MPNGSTTGAELATAFVDTCVPALRRSLRLPSYTQPLITWERSAAADPTFVAFLRDTWGRLDLQDSAQFRAEDALFLRFFRLHGIAKMFEVVARHGVAFGGHVHPIHELYSIIQILVDEALFRLIPAAERRQWFPWHCFMIRQGRRVNELTLYVDSLSVHQLTDGQLIYFSRHRPTVLLQGARLPVAFTTHALHRIHERLETVPGSHGSLLDAFAYCNYLQAFAPAQVHPAQPAFALNDWCITGFWSAHYATAILGTAVENGTHAYHLGYCPTMQAEGFHVAKTLLLPGHIGTPEYSTVLHASLDPGVKESLLAQCERLCFAEVVRMPDLNLFRWFHTHGVPQVFPAPPDMFVYD